MKKYYKPAEKKRKKKIKKKLQDAYQYMDASNYFMILEEDMKLNDAKKKPCAKCPYKLGAVETPVNPCPQCKLNNYDACERFLKLPWQGEDLKNSME